MLALEYRDKASGELALTEIPLDVQDDSKALEVYAALKESHSRFLAPYFVSVAQVVRLIQLAIDNEARLCTTAARRRAHSNAARRAADAAVAGRALRRVGDGLAGRARVSGVAGVAARARVAAIARVASRACVAAEGRAGEPAGARQSRCAAGRPRSRLASPPRSPEVRRRG